MTNRESQPTSAVAPMVRASLAKPSAVETPNVPLASFADDLDDKIALTRMRDAQKQREDDMMTAPRMVTKEEASYRYANVREQSCGACAHFSAPGSCTRVIGLIRPVDTCDEWERGTAPMAASETEMPGTGAFLMPSIAASETVRTAVQSEAIARQREGA